MGADNLTHRSRVRIAGGRPGLEKASMTQAIRAYLGLGMAEDTPDRDTAVALAAALRELGADAVAEGDAAADGEPGIPA